jgi:hypothetical protein
VRSLRKPLFPELRVGEKTQRRAMSDFVILLLFLAAWFALQRWILPRFGIST